MSCICKTLERMINERLVWYLEKNIITEFQSGSRHQRSTNDHLVRLETFIREAFIKKEHLVAVFFDLEKAYDTTWKYGTRGYQKVLSLTWKEPEIWIYSALFFNVVPFQLHTLVPSSFPVINTRSVEVNILVP